MSDYCMVITSATQENAKEIASQLVTKKMAACVQMFAIDSVYEWDSGICFDKEVLLLIKTRNHLYNEVENFIKALHEYQIPEILKFDIADGYKGYLEWIVNATK